MSAVRRWLAQPLTYVSVLLLAGVAVLAVFLARQHPDTSGTERARVTQALATAQKIALDSTSFDYAQLSTQFATLQSELTGDALKQFQSQQSGIQTYFTQNKIVTTTSVNTAAVVPGATAQTAIVMVALTQAQTVAGQPQASISVLLRMTMGRSGDRWVAVGEGYVTNDG